MVSRGFPVWLLGALLSCAPSPTETFDLESTAVGDMFRLFVQLPDGYGEGDARYPLVVQLDANLPFLEEFAVTAQLAAQQSTPVVVVGVGYPNAQDAGRLRNRDFALPLENETFRASWESLIPAPAPDAFYAFLRDELLPELRARYRLEDASQTALFGHSMGGLFTIYAATRHDEAPVFSTYVAASPSLFWDDAQAIGRFDATPPFATPLSLLVTDGTLEGPEMSGFVDAFADRARLRDNVTFEWLRFGTGHLGSVEPSFRAGLRLVLEGTP